MTFVIDPETKEKLEDFSEGAVETVTDAVNMYLTARAIKAKAEAKIEEITKEADDSLLPLLYMLDLEKVKFPGAGTLKFTVKPESHSFDKKILQQTLLEKGVSSKVIATAMKAADIVTHKDPYKIVFTKESKKKKKS